MSRWIFAASPIVIFGCGPHHQTPPEHADHATSPASQPAPVMTPQLAAFRNQLRNADDATWRRLDMAYLQLESALARNLVRDLDYPEFVQQLGSADPDTRTNGMCGLAASKSPAAVDHLERALRTDSDPLNRTIAVWCIRYCARDHRAADVLLKFLANCRDIDLGRALDADGQVKDFHAPFPVAGMEAFKALVALKGKSVMFDGPGWDTFVRRAAISIHPEPVTALNLERLKGSPGEARSDPAATVRKWIDEMRD